MNSGSFDIAIVGSGFAGSIMAMIAVRLGYRVVLIEKGKHPRFVIGESTTPLTNLLLEQLAADYDLPRLLPFCEWGKWQKIYPQIAAGLKRGFTFYHHHFNQEFVPSPDHRNQLMVAASPRDELADTHWYRPEFDAFLVQEARALGVEYWDETGILELREMSDGIELVTERSGHRRTVSVRLLIDATGPRSALSQLLPGEDAQASAADFPATQGLYTHFSGVHRFAEVCPVTAVEIPPYPPDDAALHHVFDGGWIWVLRFNNGITSAGAAATPELAEELRFHEGQPAWERLLVRLPSVRKQFEASTAILPFIHAPQLPFRRERVAGSRWVRLPSAVGFVDPLLSSGFPLTLLGIRRLARMLAAAKGEALPKTKLDEYASQTLADLDWTFRIVGALYSKMHDFEEFSKLSLLYFAAASFTETALRLGQSALCGDGFLLRDNPRFRQAAEACFAAARKNISGDRDSFSQQCLEVLGPFDVAGLARAERQNWHPIDSRDLCEAAGKLGVSPSQITEFLERFGIA